MRLRPLSLAFLLIALPAGLSLALATPPGQVPDEAAHAMRVLALADGELLGHREVVRLADGRRMDMAGVTGDPAFFGILFPVGTNDAHPETFTGARAQADIAARWSGADAFVPIGSHAAAFPITYLPAAVGLAVARALGALPFAALLAARLATLGAFVLVGLLALQVARRGRVLLFCMLALPMTLSLAGSVNDDALLIAGSALAGAVVTRGDRRGWWIAAVLVAAVACVKPPYVALGALLLPPIPRGRPFRSPGLRARTAACAASTLPAIVWTAWMAATVATAEPRAPYAAGPLWPGPTHPVFSGIDVRAQLGVLFAEPTRLATLPGEVLLGGHRLAVEMVGVLGLLSLELPHWFYFASFAALACAAVADAAGGDQPGPWWPESLLLATAALAGAWLVAISQYLMWTNVGLDHIEGMQGRYLIPIIPLIAVAVPLVAVRPRWRHWVAAVPVAVAALGAVLAPLTILGAYYWR